MVLTTAPLGRRDNFPYQKLGSREIRLVTLNKSAMWSRDSSPSCSVQRTLLPENSEIISSTLPSYAALSYTWGDGESVTSLRMEDEETRKSGDITITTSLMQALQTILEDGTRRVMWIDQLCINQSSTAEKGEQVQMMRWIYERAASVIVWQGPAYDDSDLAMQYLDENNTNSLMRDLYDQSQARFTPQLSLALQRLFHRPYWTRTWAVQEATAMRSLRTVVCCGRLSVQLGRIFEWASAGYMSLNKVSDRIANMQGTGLRAMHRFWYLRRDPVQALNVLVVRVRILLASDPRDKVYSMLNFATDAREVGLKPDYTKTVRQTYTEFVLWSMSKYKCLDVLGDCHPALSEESAPSWVPDYNEDTWARPFIKTLHPDNPGSPALYEASGQYVRDLKVLYPVDINSRLLLLSGIRVGTIDLILNDLPARFESWSTHQSWEPRNSEYICPLNNLPMSEVFRRTLYLDTREISSDKFVRGTTLALPWELDLANVSSQDANGTRYPRAMGFGRCPFYTRPGPDSSPGLLGFSVIAVKPDDELWILKGGKMPLILRPNSITIPLTDLETGEAFALPADIGMPTYEFVGEAFVLGMMHGEILEMIGHPPKRQRPPPLADMDDQFRTIGLI